MGYSYYERDGKPCGYSVGAVCEQPGCGEVIDRGLAYCCGDDPGEDEISCAGYFCPKHLSYRSDPFSGDDDRRTRQVCPECARAWTECPACEGSEVDDEGEECPKCGGEGEVFDPEFWDTHERAAPQKCECGHAVGSHDDDDGSEDGDPKMPCRAADGTVCDCASYRPAEVSS